MKDKKSILVITSFDEIKDTVFEAMEEQRYRLISATNANEARLKFSNEEFDYIVMDMEFKGLDTLEFIENVRRKETQRSIAKIRPVVVMGDKPEVYTANFAKLDMVNFIQTPFTPLEFKKKLLSFTGNSEIILSNTSTIEKGEYLITEGGTSHEMYWILSGGFTITKTNAAGYNVIIGEASPGELVGEMSFLDNQPRSASVIAKEDSEFLIIPHKKFIDVVDGQPRWFRSLMQTLSQRLRASNQMVARKQVGIDTTSAEVDEVDESEKPSI